MTTPSLPSVELMHPTLLPHPFHRDGLVYEETVDGYRMLAYKTGRTVKLISRNGRDHTSRFSELAPAIQGIGHATLDLDGEGADFDKQLLSRFEWLRHRVPPDLATPPIFVAFDCLHARGKDLRAQPLHVRRNTIEDVLDGQDPVLPARRLADDGLKAWQEVLERGYEGLVAKDPASPYRGGRTLLWLKVKQLPRRGAGVGSARRRILETPLKKPVSPHRPADRVQGCVDVLPPAFDVGGDFVLAPGQRPPELIERPADRRPRLEQV